MSTSMTAQELQAYRMQQAATNKAFLDNAMLVPVIGSSLNGTSFTNTSPSSLKFQISGINGAWLRKIRVQTSGSLTYTAAATSPTCSVNAVGLDGIYSAVKLSYGSSYKPTLRPIVFSMLDQLRGYGRLRKQDPPIVSDDGSVITGAIYNNTNLKPGSALAAGTNNFLHTMDVPMQLLHPAHPSGMLPVDTTGTVFTIELVPNIQGLVGTDPLDNLVNTNGTVTLGTCTVTVTFYYSDGRTITGTSYYQPDMTALPSAEFAEVTDQNIYANQLVVQQLNLALPIARLLSIVIDGESSSQFAQVQTPSNTTTGVSQYALLKGANVNDAFISYDTNTGGVSNYYTDFRDRFGTDLPAGVFVHDGLTSLAVNPSNRNGVEYWNTSDGVWAAARQGFKVAAVGSNGTPRVVTYAIVQNPAGIIK